MAEATPGRYRPYNKYRAARDAREQHELEHPPSPEEMEERRKRAVRDALKVRARCRWHQVTYQANKIVGGQAMAADCPYCENEKAWIRKAMEVHGAAMLESDPHGLTWLAQGMAGHAFHRFRAEKPKDPIS